MNATSTATSITVCFEFPVGSTQNGRITSFDVTLVGSPFNITSRTFSIPVTSTEYPLNGYICGNVTNLEEYNDFNITSVVLISSAGTGPSSPSVLAQTLQASKFQHKF